jgi:hypothetical protein
MMTLCTKRFYHDSGRMLVAAVQDYQESQVLLLGKVIELLWKDSPDSVLLGRTAVRVNVSEA